MEARAHRRLAAAVLLALCAGAPVLAGEIAGKLGHPERVKSVSVVDLATNKTYPAVFDPKDPLGMYRASNLPEGRYAVILETTAGRIEGVDLGDRGWTQQTSFEVWDGLKPTDLDRDEIPRIAARLAQIYAERRKAKLDPKSFVARVREGKLAGVSLVADAAYEVPLEGDEPVETGDAILGLMAVVKARDRLPSDYDLHILLAEGPQIHWRKVAPELTDKDRAWIVDWVDKLKLFENKKRVLDMEGTGERARVLVEKLRDDDAGPTTLPVKEPTAFWRIEIWEFNKHYGGWTKDKATVVVREQVTIREFRTYRWMFEKRLGGIAVAADGTATVPPYEVPEKLDPAKGRVPY